MKGWKDCRLCGGSGYWAGQVGGGDWRVYTDQPRSSSPESIKARFEMIFPDPQTESSRRGGAASRRLGIKYERNPYPDGLAIADREPALAAEYAAKRAAWSRGWLEADAAEGWETSRADTAASRSDGHLCGDCGEDV